VTVPPAWKLPPRVAESVTELPKTTLVWDTVVLSVGLALLTVTLVVPLLESWTGFVG
jgi:hypothetical protein